MTTVAIAGGAGGVGSSLAFNLLLRPEPYDVVVIDRRPEKVLSHVMDLEQVPALAGGGSVRPGECGVVATADIVVICAAAPLTENTSRAVYLQDNAAIVAGLAERLGSALVVVVTNPVDLLCTRLVERHGLDRRRVVGYTLNDSLRLRTAIAAAREVPPAAVDAFVVGEHGDAAVPVFSRVAVHGERVTLDAAEREQAAAFVRTWYRRHVALDSRLLHLDVGRGRGPAGRGAAGRRGPLARLGRPGGRVRHLRRGGDRPGRARSARGRARARVGARARGAGRAARGGRGRQGSG